MDPAQQPQQPQQPRYVQQPQPQPQQYAQQAPYAQQMAPQDFKDNSTMMIVLSALEFFFLGGLLAIIPLIFTLQMKSAISSCNWQEAVAKQKIAKQSLAIVAIIAACLYLLIGMFTCTTMVAAFSAAASY